MFGVVCYLPVQMGAHCTKLPNITSCPVLVLPISLTIRPSFAAAMESSTAFSVSDEAMLFRQDSRVIPTTSPRWMELPILATFPIHFRMDCFHRRDPLWCRSRILARTLHSLINNRKPHITSVSIWVYSVN